MNEEFRKFCVDQLQRFDQFEAFRFMSSATHKDYRRWLERKCQTYSRVQHVMDAAVEAEKMPTMAELNQIFVNLFGIPSYEPALTLEERQARAEYLRDWYAQEAREAAERREKAQQRKAVDNPITEVDFEKLRTAR